MPAGGGGHPQQRKRAPVVPQAPSPLGMCLRDNFLHPLLCKKKLSATHPHAAPPPQDILKTFSNPCESMNCNVLQPGERNRENQEV